MRVNLSHQVREFVRRLAPDPRGRVRRGLRLLEKERGDIKALEGDLACYYRLRIRSYRVIFAYRGTKRPGPPEIDCLFCEHRSVVYEAFAAMAAGDPGSLSRHGG